MKNLNHCYFTHISGKQRQTAIYSFSDGMPISKFILLFGFFFFNILENSWHVFYS